MFSDVIFLASNTNRWPGSKVPYLFISTFADMIKAGRFTFDSLIQWNLKDLFTFATFAANSKVAYCL